MISIDGSARVTYVNSAFERTFGYRAEEVIGRELAEVIVPPSLREAHRQGLARYLATGESRILDRRIEVAAMRADGSEFPAEMTVTRTGLPGRAAFTGYMRDITERQRAQQELMASRARLVAASDAARQRVTRDLHDGAQQRLVATLINLQLAEQKWESAPQRARELLGLAIRDARRGDRRTCARSPRAFIPAILTQHGLAAAVRRARRPAAHSGRRSTCPPAGCRRRSRRACTSSVPKRSLTSSSTRGPASAWVRVERRARTSASSRSATTGSAAPAPVGDQRPHRAARPNRRARAERWTSSARRPAGPCCGP